MKIEDISVPEVYKESSDFRFFIKWFQLCLTKIQYLTENLLDLYDPLRCPEDLLWMLGDTIGFRYDDRFPTSYNRLLIYHFMEMIKYKGSLAGMSLAAELNLDQFNIIQYGKEKDILNNRLEDTSYPVNSTYVLPHTEEGYIDVIYYATQLPTDATTEYVRPIGMYLFPHIGVALDARNKLSIDARLTTIRDVNVKIGYNRVGNYTANDYSRMQGMKNQAHSVIDTDDKRQKVWNRNSKAEGKPKDYPNPGWRSLYSLELANNEHMVSAMIKPLKGKDIAKDINPNDVIVSSPKSSLNDLGQSKVRHRRGETDRIHYVTSGLDIVKQAKAMEKEAEARMNQINNEKPKQEYKSKDVMLGLGDSLNEEGDK